MVMKMAEIVSDAFLLEDAPVDVVGLKHDVSAITAIIQEALCTGKRAEGLMRLQRRSKSCHREHSHDTDLVPQARFALDEGRNICTPSTHTGPISHTNVSVIRVCT